MKKTTFVALLILSLPCLADNLADRLNNVESEWASIYYSTPKHKQGTAYLRLLDKTLDLSRRYPGNAEPIFWQAVVKATYADHQDALSALKTIHEARDLLVKAIAINPETMEGSAYVTLGTLYYLAPKWPIAFGDDNEAEKMFQSALKINPDGIDTNYFYGEFLLSIDNPKDAVKYLERAANAPARTEQLYADNQLKEEARLAMKNAMERKVNGAKNTFLSLFNSASVE
jgi:tetratricopeptide (TPR) repeat protein